MVFLKLDFSKAYDKASSRFLFHAMHMFGINEEFIGSIRLLFGCASAVVNLNNSPGTNFKRFRQGCPLVPDLFLIIGEVLTHAIKKTILEGRIRGITLSGGKKITKHITICG